ncbi:unnamed protein product [Agarophyton chilense]|eukprot:gb/GEZJ01001225.1/.p1 GENE.gb/GEZJ01001225.1/~~gb/GEZJ01001225.1/.p1  ORF type:complete len:893 (-),score=129.74 gb/GEZJ01001225.1/:380-3058(-)
MQTQSVPETAAPAAEPAQTKENSSFWSDPRPSNRNPNFVHDYFQSSRLHFIGSFRARYESMMVSVAKRLNVSPGSLINTSPKSTSRQRVIIHIDMDCFFASVAVKRDPSLRGKCIAVCHGGGEISSCSYEARKFGIRAGMFAKDARRLCPQLLSVPYHFPSYEEISIQIYSLFYDYPGVYVEAVSVDEAYLDATEAVATDTSQFNAENLVENIRSRIVMETGCTASAGIGPSKLMARLATKAAKPNGQLRVHPEKVIEYIDALKVSDLPGVGRRTSKKMTELGINNVPDLRNKSLSFLQTKFGNRQGQNFHDLARAVDRRLVQPLKPRKSIGAEASWGIRFDQDEDKKLKKFITDMASEVVSRVVNAGANGSKMVIKVYRKKPNSSMVGYKFLGHGPCTIVSRIYNMPRNCGAEMMTNALRDSCLRVISETRMRNDEFRGIGMQILDLKFGDLKFDHSRTAVAGIKHVDFFFAAAKNSSSNGVQRDFIRKSESVTKTVRNRGSSLPLTRDGNDGEKSHIVESVDNDSEKIVVAQGKNRDNMKNEQGSDRLNIQRKEDQVISIEIDENDIQKPNVVDDHVASMRQSESNLTQKIPRGWDRAVFKALPLSLQTELLESNVNQSIGHRDGVAGERSEHGEVPLTPVRRDNRKRSSIQKKNEHVAQLLKRPRRRQKAQVTMTQFADIRELRDKGNDVLNGEEFRSKPLRECIELLHDLKHGRRSSTLGRRRGTNGGKRDKILNSLAFPELDNADAGDALNIPSPPSMSSDGDSNDGDKILKIVQQEGVEHEQIYAEEEIEVFSEKLYVWMNHSAGNVKSAHVELLRGRLMEFVRLKQLEHVSENLRLLRRFAESDSLKTWRPSINVLLQEVGEETHRQHGLNLRLPPVFANSNLGD